jgi:vitellogenic carboxypeptidase-like protein
MKKKTFAMTGISLILLMMLSLSVSLPVWAEGDYPEEKRIWNFPGNILGTTTITLYPDPKTTDIITPDQKTISYAGYSRVGAKEPKTGERYDSYLFYWFFESRNAHLVKKEKKKDIPLLIWLTGGPGASSLIGCFMENGPYLVSSDDTVTIVKNPHSWNQECHMIYWDQPVGTGYSYSKPAGHYAHSEPELSRQLYFAMQEFYHRHPEYRSCPLYVTGESQGGKYVPSVARKIVAMNQRKDIDRKKYPLINLKGISVGDGWIYPDMQLQKQIQYAYSLGFIDTGQRKRIEGVYQQFIKLWNSGDYYKAFRLGNMISEIIVACAGNVAIYDVRSFTGLSVDYIFSYFNSKIVKKALGLSPCRQWTFADNAGPVAASLAKDVYQDSTSLYEYLLDNNIRILCYTGNFDMSCGFMGTEEILQKLKWSRRHDWGKLKRKVWVDSHVKTLGYVKYLKKNNQYQLMQVNVVGAGHQVPYYKPQVSRAMVYNWIFGREFSTYDPLAHLQKKIDRVLNSQ